MSAQLLDSAATSNCGAGGGGRGIVVLVEQTETSEAARGRWTVAAGTYAISTRWLVGQFTRGRACRRAVVCVCVCTLLGQDVCFRVDASPWWNLGTTMVTRPARIHSIVGARGPPTKQIRFSVFPRPRTLLCRGLSPRGGKKLRSLLMRGPSVVVLIIARRQGCVACSARLAACAARLD